MNEKHMWNDLAALIAIASVSTDTAACRAALELVLARAREMGMRTGITEQGDAGWAEIGEGDVTLGILAHVDVVDIGDRAKWNSDPFCLTERDGCLFGRGVEDDKGPVIQCLYAMAALLEENIPLRKKIRLIVGTSEETVWTDMEHYKAQFGVPDYGFSPDAAFPIYNAEKGCADVRLYFPADGYEQLFAGEATNTVPSFAKARRTDKTELTAEGVSVHSSAPEKGDNAIVRLAEKAGDGALWRFLTEVFRAEDPAVKLGLDDGGDRCQGVYVGKTVCAPTVLRLENGEAVLTINIRYRPGVTRAALEAAFERAGAAYGFRFEMGDVTTPMMVDPEQPFIRLMQKVNQSHGLESECLPASGATYCSTIPNHVGWGPVIPPDEGSAHEENENVRRADFLKALAVYTDYLRRSAQEET